MSYSNGFYMQHDCFYMRNSSFQKNSPWLDVANAHYYFLFLAPGKNGN